jgi:hypothetical protein
MNKKPIHPIEMTPRCITSQPSQGQPRHYAQTHTHTLHPLRGRKNSRPHPVRPREHHRNPTSGTNNTLQQNKEKHIRKANINIATLNMNGAASRDTLLLSKWGEISRTLYENKIAILALQETHMDGEMTNQVREIFSKNLDIIISEDPTSPQSKAGVAFIINKALINPQKITTHELVPGRALLLKMKWLEGCETKILNIYAPVNRAAQPQFWQSVESERHRRNITRPEFVIGDFNITEEAIDRAPPRLDDQAAMEALRNIRLKWEIQDSWRHAHQNVREFTYRTNTRERTAHLRLDRIYTAKHQHHLFNWNHSPAIAHTDHWMVMVKYAPKDAPLVGEGRWSWPRATIEDNELIKKVVARGKALQNNITNWKTDDTDQEKSNPQTLWANFKSDITKIAKEHAKTSIHKINAKVKSLEQNRKSIAVTEDFTNNEERQIEEALIANEITHLERAQAKTKKEIFKARRNNHGKKLGGIWSVMSKNRKPRDPIY